VDSKQLIKWGMIAVAAYFVYEWLVTNGYIGSTVAAASNVFTDPAALLNYCQANPMGTAIYNGSSASCASWIAANTPAPPLPAPVASAPIVSTPVPVVAPVLPVVIPAPAIVPNLSGWVN
jgi:hypothetical protein